MDRQTTTPRIAVAMLAAVPLLTLCAVSAGQTPPGERPATAEELLETLRNRRPANDVIPPHSANPTERVASRLLPEGFVVIDRAGTITSVDDWWVFTSVDGETKLRLLPNLTLETMVRMTQASETPLRFAVSGELLVFGGANYLLVRSAPRAEVHPHEPQAPPKATEDNNVAPKQTDVVKDDDPSDILKLMGEQQRDRPIIPTPNAEKRDHADRGASAFAGLLDGSALVDRPGRLARQGDWWMILFESDHPDHPEPPMRLLPCSGTELMVDATRRFVGGVVFAVSGEVTSFFGTNYLLPRAVTRQFASGNLRK